MNKLKPGYFLFLTFGVILLACGSNYSSPKVNRKLFIKFFNLDPPTDVKNFYYHSDELGIDASYWISFESSDTTIQKIRQSLQLDEERVTRGLFGGLNSYPTQWWDTTFIFKAKAYTKQEQNIFWFLWYDRTNRKAYFLTLDT